MDDAQNSERWTERRAKLIYGVMDEWSDWRRDRVMDEVMDGGIGGWGDGLKERWIFVMDGCIEGGEMA